MGTLNNAKASTDCRVCSQPGKCQMVQNLDAKSLSDLHRRTKRIALARGDVLFREGEDPSGIWVVCEGSIKIFRHANDGRPLINRIAGQGDFVGHRSYFLGRPYAGSAAAMEPSLVRYFDRALVEQLVFSEGSFAGIILRRLAIELGHAEARATHMAYGSARNRVIDVLNDLYLAHQEAEHPDELVVRRQDLAELAGMAVETIVRVLKELERDGLVAIQGRQIQVVSPKRLVAEVS